MFLKHFTPAQRKNLVILAYQMMVADHRVRADEKDLVDAPEHEIGFHEPIASAELFAEPDLSVFDDRATRVAVMLKLFSIAYSDREMHSNELVVLRAYAGKFGSRPANSTFSMNGARNTRPWWTPPTR